MELTRAWVVDDVRPKDPSADDAGELHQVRMTGQDGEVAYLFVDPEDAPEVGSTVKLDMVFTAPVDDDQKEG